MQTRVVSALEYEALLNLDHIIRISMSKPNTAEFLVSAIQALDRVRESEAPKQTAAAQAVADALIARAAKP